MQTMLKTHRKKIDAAIDLCEKALMEVLSSLPSGHDDLSKLLYENTFFAGGVFRSIFTNTKVNDIDIYFSSKHAAMTFKHIVASDKNLLKLFEVTTNDTFKVLASDTPTTLPVVTFITSKAGKPDEVIRTFDFTFNQHYFSLPNFAMRFNIQTFKKCGNVNYFAPSSSIENVATLQRAHRFLQDGFRIGATSMNRIIDLVVNYKRTGEHISIPTSLNSSSEYRNIEVSPAECNDFYTQSSYFKTQPRWREQVGCTTYPPGYVQAQADQYVTRTYGFNPALLGGLTPLSTYYDTSLNDASRNAAQTAVTQGDRLSIQRVIRSDASYTLMTDEE